MGINILSRALRRQSRASRSWIYSAGLAVALCLGAPVALAQGCSGTDQRDQIDAALRADIQAELAQSPYATGLFWRASRGAQTVHVIGTFHLNDPRFAAWMPRLTAVLDQADTLLVESTPADQAQLQTALSRDMSHAFITDGPTLVDLLGPEDWASIAAQAKAAGVPPMLAAKMQPWFLSLALALPLCAKQDPNLKNGLDARLIAHASAQDIPVAALEDPMGVIRLFSDVPIAEQVEDLRGYLAVSQVDEDQLASLSAAYFEENVLEYALQEEARFISQPGPKSRATRTEELAEMMEKLLYDRNRAWVPVIQNTAGDHLVVAVGALHLPGEAGLLQLLQDQGFTLQQLPLPAS